MTTETKKGATWMAFLALAPLVGAGFLVAQGRAVAAGEVLLVRWDWIPSLGVSLSFRLDGYSLLFGLLITIIGAAVLLYGSAYMAGAAKLGRFTATLMAFMAAMAGLVLSDNLLLLFVFWELTTLTSFLLIGYDSTNEGALRAARQSLIVTGGGGLSLLAGLLLLGSAAGTYEFTEILASASAVQSHENYGLILILVLVGAFTKSAQIPFHFWLPAAMAAPTPVSTYLHSATMVKAGIYLLARLTPVLGGTQPWMVTLTVVGGATALWASLQSLRKRDLKAILAYTTLMALGTSVMFLGAPTQVGLTAAVTFVLVHALYKAALFMVVGIIDHEAGTRNIDELGGLRRVMPVTAIAAGLAALSMAGLPPFIGFVGKELMYKGALAWGPEPAVAVVTIVAAKVMMVAVAILLVVRPFFGATKSPNRVRKEAPWQMWLAPLLLGLVALLFGLAPDILGEALVVPAVEAVMGEPSSVGLALWHGVNVPLLLSVVTVALGALLYVNLEPVGRTMDWAAAVVPLQASTLFERSISGFVTLADRGTRAMQHGRLRSYLRVILGAVVVALAAAGWQGGVANFMDGEAQGTPLGAIEVGLGIILLATTYIVVTSSSRLLSIGGLGVLGTAMALLFLLYGAPDLAVTQLLVETLVVVLAAFVLLRIPRCSPKEATRSRLFDGVIAVSLGTIVSFLVYSVSSRPPDRGLTQFFERASVPQGYGQNIVNVILVDFRAFDTLGEIVVVMVAALAALALTRPALDAPSGERSTPLARSVIVRQASRLLMVLMLVFAVFMLLRGHNEPGGGFIAGLLGATAFSLAILGSGREALLQALRVHPLSLSAFGVLLALVAGAMGALFGEVFFDALWLNIGGVKIGTPLLFDAGVSLVVVGMMLSFVLVLKERK